MTAPALLFLIMALPARAQLPAAAPWGVPESIVARELSRWTPSSDPGRRLTPEEARRIGRLIWRNEGGGRVEALTHWNVGEDFASMGIGHFIWYPEERRGPFTEHFPALLAYLEKSGAALPAWLAADSPCPWPDRAAFMADFDSPRMRELRELLASTVELQARYIAFRSEQSLPRILAAADPAERPRLRRQYYRVAAEPAGIYALVDYVNFKGEGVNPAERYGGLGWGLLQVLERLRGTAPGQPALDEFAAAAAWVLERRVANSPPARNEARWLPGWKRRVATYREPLPD